MHWAYRSTGDLCGSRLDNGHKKSAILRFLTCGTSVLPKKTSPIHSGLHKFPENILNAMLIIHNLEVNTNRSPKIVTLGAICSVV